ncbi:DNA-directed RNA polymerase I subunit RPA43 [Lecanosticta acicola]|uniref:DNA-directed RNA polymerase subunit n=1 Tax=Lecanosticta acicola TaxID=111012 RepID=A0AAI8W1K7_9PEZI|nr:DNA-directed RNA polymerase I subunit RPA43 [Lecanosticta acicola]
MGKSKHSKSAASDGKKSAAPFLQIRTSFYLPLSPCAYRYALDGLCAEHLSPHVLQYYPPLHGVLLSYTNLSLSQQPPRGTTTDSSDEDESVLCKSINEYGVSFVWLTGDFTIFRPEKGTTLEGDVNLQSESVLGLMCYNYFNASVDRDSVPEDWTWDGEHWLRNGKSVSGRVSFKVVDFEPSGDGAISITGSLKEV